MPIYTPPDPDKAREENRANSLKALNFVWQIEKGEFKDRMGDIRNFGYKIPISLFLAASFIIVIVAGFSDTYGHKSFLQLISIGILYTLGALLAITLLAFSVLATKWGYMFYIHKKHSKETRMIMGDDYFAVRFKEYPPEIFWGLSIILVITTWYLITQLTLMIPYLGNFIYWAIE
jgi:hypothetical protein